MLLKQKSPPAVELTDLKFRMSILAAMCIQYVHSHACLGRNCTEMTPGSAPTPESTVFACVLN